MAHKKAGWYDDPSTPRRMRWWDGQAWTDQLSDDRKAPPPAQAGHRVVPVRTLQDKVIRWGLLGLVALALVIAVLATIGMVENRRHLSDTGRIDVSAAPTRLPLGNQIYPTGKVLDFDGAGSITFPDKDFEEPTRDEESDNGLWALRYRSLHQGTGPGSGAPPALTEAGMGAEGVFSVGYGPTSAGVVARDAIDRHFPTGVVVSAMKTAEHTVGKHPGWTAEATISYQVDGVQVTSTVRAATVEFRPGDWMVWVGLWHESTPPQVKASIEKSLASLTIKD